MAAGYLHNAVCTALLAAGAEPSLRDRQGRDIPGLLDSLRDKMTSAQARASFLLFSWLQAQALQMSFSDEACPPLLTSASLQQGADELRTRTPHRPHP
jgi:hypothetical protein